MRRPPQTDDGSQPSPAGPTQLVEHFFRHETGRLHGALLRRFGIEHFALVEDVTQEALLRALRAWSMGGLPPNPAAWVTRVATNLALDALRHRRMATEKEPEIARQYAPSAPPSVTAEGMEAIGDDALRLMFVCSHPKIATDAQVVLALKVLCGFSTAEIAEAFLSSETAIEKQLTRTKQRIRTAGIRFEIPEGEDLQPRLNGVLGTIYLLFNEGYKASTGSNLLREDLCKEAIRICGLLVSHPQGNTPAAQALLALMLLNAARFPTRLDSDGLLLRIDVQDRSKWDQSLIDRGLCHLANAASGEALTEYHLQAGIAAIHCTAPDAASTDWSRIVGHYDALLRLRPSPVFALNRAVAVASLHGAQVGLEELEAIPDRTRLESSYLLHAVRGELFLRMKNNVAAKEAFRRAHQLATVAPEKAFLGQMLKKASSNEVSPSEG